MDLNTGRWNESRLEQVFGEAEIKGIMEIQLSKQRRPDQIVWSMTKNRVYTVKSGYFLLHKNKLEATENPCSQPSVLDGKEKM